MLDRALFYKIRAYVGVFTHEFASVAGNACKCVEYMYSKN